MDDVTDTVFRHIIAECAKPDLFYTEFVNVDGLQSPGRQKLVHKLRFSEKEKPILAQIWGKNPENYLKTVKELLKMDFAGIDINMGCPDKAVVKNGCGSALINNRGLAKDIIAATKEGTDGKLPVTVKIRTGFKEVDLTWPEFILQQNIDALTVHGRTTKDMSKVPARWADIGKIREIRDAIAPNTLIIGNGDVKSRIQGEELANKYKLDGIMIGRGIFADPFCFSEKSNWQNMVLKERVNLFLDHLKLFQKVYPDGVRNPQDIKKYAKIYINGFDGASIIRNKIMEMKHIDEMINVLKRNL